MRGCGPFPGCTPRRRPIQTDPFTVSAEQDNLQGHPAQVLLFSTVFPPFIAEDERLLRRHFALRKLIASGPRAFLALVPAILRSDVVLTWFGSVYSAFNTAVAHLAHKPSLIVVGGVDAARLDEIGYGIWLSRWKSVIVRYAFRNAERVLVVDGSLGDAARRLAAYDGNNISYLPTGYDAGRWPGPSDGRDNVILTVATCDTMRRVQVKGIDKLLHVARNMPGTSFRIIGMHPNIEERLRPDVPANVKILPPLPQEQLAEEYGKAKVYCQPSLTEGLPNTLCEAMLCGCIPVGTRVGGIPTAIGETGFVVDYGNEDALSDALRQALSAPPGKGLEARHRIMTEFAVSKREEGLRAIIAEELRRSP